MRCEFECECACEPIIRTHFSTLSQNQEAEITRKELIQSRVVETAMILVSSFVRIRGKKVFKKDGP